ncbi:hypothetical protein C2W62_42215 [Candidatus Entotheonella serta]|nr:hypothetical protein C2W62_42215 [Candidatus Entotheonella serta]
MLGIASEKCRKNIINPTATLRTAGMMLAYLGLSEVTARLEQAIERVYAEGKTLTPDQGGSASTQQFCDAVASYL